MEEFYYLVRGQREGPVSRAEMNRLLRLGEISDTTYAWRPGSPEWRLLPQVLHEGEKWKGDRAFREGLGRFEYASIMVVAGAALKVTSPSSVILGINIVLVLVVHFLAVLHRVSSIGVSRWWVIAAFIPLVNIPLALCLVALPKDYKKARKLDMAAKIIVGCGGIVLVLMMGLTACVILK